MRQTLPALILTILIFITACEVKTPLTNRTIKYDGTTSVFDITSYTHSNITLTGVEGKDVYIVRANGRASTTNESSAMSISPLNSQNARLDDQLSDRNESIEPEFTVLPHLPSMNFNPADVIKMPTSSNLLRNVSTASVERNIGDSNSFWINDNIGSIVKKEDFKSITAKVRAKGEHCYIWVDDAHWSLVPTFTNAKITQTLANSLADKFDYIYPIVTNLFGYEKGGGSGGDGGIDRDKRISILVYDIAGDYTPGNMSGIVGYFWGKDEFDDGVIPNMRSNESEIFYIDSGFAKEAIELVYSTLAHEFQHMINFNQKGEATEVPAWYNEMLSMLCEDVMVTHLNTPLSSSPAGTRPKEFSQYYTTSGITEWNGATSYGTAFTFGAFLTRNYGGIELIAEMSRNRSVGIESINDALASCGYSTTFDNVFWEFSKALVRRESSGLPGFDKDTPNTTYGNYSYRQAGFNLWDSKLGGGPYAYDFYSNYGQLRPYGNKVHSNRNWLDVSGDSISFQTGEYNSSSVKSFLVVR